MKNNLAHPLTIYPTKKYSPIWGYAFFSLCILAILRKSFLESEPLKLLQNPLKENDVISILHNWIKKHSKDKTFISYLNKQDVKMWEYINNVEEAQHFYIRDSALDVIKKNIKKMDDIATTISEVLEMAPSAEIYYPKEDEKSLSMLAEELSLPFEKTLFVFEKPFTGVVFQEKTTNFISMPLAFLVSENSPDNIDVYLWNVDLNTGTPATNVYKDIFNNLKYQSVKNVYILMKAVIDSISVKRIGIEKNSLKSWAVKGGVKKFKKPHVYHIAGKVEYEYETPRNNESKIEWEAHFRRGHWRAFYLPPNQVDEMGRRIVDKTKIGKNRAGEYKEEGYTWVVETMIGDPATAIKKIRSVNPGNKK